MMRKGIKRTVLYVSASNRAVDVFGNYLMKRFKLANTQIQLENEAQSSLLMSAVRIYSQQIQNNEYPNPSFFNKLKSPAKKRLIFIII